jgi:hypothetical protein
MSVPLTGLAILSFFAAASTWASPARACTTFAFATAIISA